MKKTVLLFLFFSFVSPLSSQPFVFAHITDTHVGGTTGAEDLRLAVEDINSWTK